uniref:TNase-like domain-containing protein n=1 Tax=viral metagenome TaxID=1070528 RepID=A0A6C0B9E1_9ZZZZ
MCLGFVNFWFSNKDDYLANIEYKDTEKFVLPIQSGKVVKVYDGDTITIASKFPGINGRIYRFSVRMNGIDSPELKGGTENEKELAKRSRDALSNIIMGKIVDLKNVSTEKYGRILADVYLGDLNICDWMLINKYAVKYDGGTKHRPEDWSL